VVKNSVEAWYMRGKKPSLPQEKGSLYNSSKKGIPIGHSVPGGKENRFRREKKELSSAQDRGGGFEMLTPSRGGGERSFSRRLDWGRERKGRAAADGREGRRESVAITRFGQKRKPQLPLSSAYS